MMRLIDADKLRLSYWVSPTSTVSTAGQYYFYSQAEVDNAPTIDPVLFATKVLKHFITEECKDIYTACIEVKKDGTRLQTDWGYFEEGLNEIEKWAMKDEENDEVN